jgi:branched-chain amino acid transport system permease protein
MNRPRILWGLTLGALVLALIAPHILYPIFLMKALCFALFAASFNLLLGYTGLLSFGHAAFFGWGGYVAAYSIKQWGLPPELGVILGMLVAAVLGLVFGALAIRRQGIYFAMITLALAQMMFFFALQVPLTGGENGIQSVPRGVLFGFVPLDNPIDIYYTVLGVFIIGLVIIARAIHSPFGQVLKAIRDNEPRAISLGYKVDRFKLLAFVLSAALSGLAGATKAVVFQLASLTDVDWHTSGEVILMTLIGGVGTIVGPIVGATIVIAIQDYLAEYGSWVTIIEGGVFVACVLAFRRGIVGEISAWIGRYRIRTDPTVSKSISATIP